MELRLHLTSGVAGRTERTVSNQQILLIDSSLDDAVPVKTSLEEAGYSVKWLETGEAALQTLSGNTPNLLLIALRLSGIDGLETCRLISRLPLRQPMPIILMMEKEDEVDTVVGLELGADDCITRGIAPRVLIARIKAVLRRTNLSKSKMSHPISLPDLSIDPVNHTVIAGDKRIALTETEMSLLSILAGQPEHVFSRAQLIDQLRGSSAAVTSRSIDVHIAALRRKLGDIGPRIETVRGVGYRYAERNS